MAARIVTNYGHEPETSRDLDFLGRGGFRLDPSETPSEDPDASLKLALHFGDLYNWADAGPLFAEAEELYAARGDKCNALYAHLGRIRSTMEQLSLPEASEELENDLESHPLLQSDRELRLFCLMVLGDVDGEIDAAPMRRDWEEALKLAKNYNYIASRTARTTAGIGRSNRRQPTKESFSGTQIKRMDAMEIIPTGIFGNSNDVDGTAATVDNWRGRDADLRRHLSTAAVVARHFTRHVTAAASNLIHQATQFAGGV